MIKFYQNVIVFWILVVYGNAQSYAGDVCTLQSSGLRGVCKFLNDCPRVKKELREHRKHPQNCGFSGSQPLVCCPGETTRKTGEISKKKCEEYAEYVKETFTPPIGLINAAPVTRIRCGHRVVELIVGGKIAKRLEFPHMAALGYGSSLEDAQWICGGTILSEMYILTAAHCLSHFGWGDAKWVTIGVTNLSSRYRRQHIEVEELIAYPEYKSSSNYYDIGLLKLKTPAELNPFARPACLYIKEQISAEKAIATGWGKTEYTGELSNDLRKTTLDLIDYNSCKSNYIKVRKLEEGVKYDSQLCAGSEQGNDTCQGDSGGPLQIYHIGDQISCMYDIVGITSIGTACYGDPAIYTRVSHFIKWIEDIVWP